MEENGGRTMIARYGKPGMAFFVPKGVIHYLLTGCDELELLQFFNHEDYGQTNIISRAMSIPREVLEVTTSPT